MSSQGFAFLFACTCQIIYLHSKYGKISPQATPVTKMRIAFLGATGETGVCVIDQGLAENHHITAVVRNPDKVTTQHANLKVSLRSR